MLNQTMIDELNALRQSYLDVLRDLGAVSSFQALLAGEESLQSQWEGCLAAGRSPRLAKPFAPSFNCALIGSSNAGKTTILSEMFPDLHELKRGWLIRDANDTTAQALRIHYAAPGSPQASQVLLRSWNANQLKQLVRTAQDENQRSNVIVRYFADRIEIDGQESNFEDRDRFHFALTQVLRPLPMSVVDISERVKDKNFIYSLTVKESSEKMHRGALLEVDGQPFEALQLRANTKVVELGDPFTELLQWAPDRASDVAQLAVIDTPGLKVTGSTNDEVLRHVLRRKNQQIIVELLREDELDVIVHVVLNTTKSEFGELWSMVVEQSSLEDLAGLEDRLILAINGFNRYFTDDVLTRKWNRPLSDKELDHIAITVEENILKTMSPYGRVRPARICFLDSGAIVNTQHTEGYQAWYARQKPIMESWLSPTSPCYETMKRLGILDSFRENLEALCDPKDRGQGYLVRQIMGLIDQNGAKLFLRRNLIRSRLLASITTLRDLLARNFDDDGKLNAQAMQSALRHCLSAIGVRDLANVETYAANHLDEEVGQVVPAPGDSSADEDWVQTSFVSVVGLVLQKMRDQPGVNQQSVTMMTKYYQEKSRSWQRNWGYQGCRLPVPTDQNPTPGELVRHCLKLHAREILCELVADSTGLAMANLAQEPKDRETVQKTLRRLDDMAKQAELLCQSVGVTT
jgi:hypothetical protein